MDKTKMVSLRAFRSGLYNDVDECVRLKKIFYEDFDNELSFSKLMTLTVKHKIVNDFLDIFNLIIKRRGRLENSDRSHCLNLMRRITKRCKIHVAQLKRFTPFATINGAIFESEIYYKKLLSAVYRSILI